MRIRFLFVFMLCFQAVWAQKEFSSPAFSTAFKKIWNDGQQGFTQLRGAKYYSLGTLFSTYRITQSLPDADSGCINLPVSYARPFATFHMKPSKIWQVIAAREKNLLAAVKAAYGQPLYEVKATDTANKFVFYRTRLFSTPNTKDIFSTMIETYTVLEKGTYKLVLNIYGKNPPPVSKEVLPEEPNLNQRIMDLLQAATSHFEKEKGVQKDKTEYYTIFESLSSLYGQKMSIKARKYETSLSFQLSFPKLATATQAKQLYDKLKAAFVQSGRFSFKPETIEGSRTWCYGSEAGAQLLKVSYTLVIEYYSSEGSPSVGFLLTKKL